MTRTVIRNMFTVALTTALAVGLAATSQAADKGCSNATLTGTFAYTNTGFFTAAAAPPAQAGPAASVGVQTFDGNGGTTATAVGKRKRQRIPGDYKGHILGESGLHWDPHTLPFHSKSPNNCPAPSGLLCDRR